MAIGKVRTYWINECAIRVMRIRILHGIIVILLCSLPAFSEGIPPREETLNSMLLANDYFVKKYPDPRDSTFVKTMRPSNIWTRAVYMEGLMALHSIYPLPEFYDYAYKWADHHKWGLDKGPVTRHADNQCCGQTYIDLYNICPDDPKKIKDIKLSIDMMVNTPQNDDWWWVDAIQMSMPVFAKLGKLTGDCGYYEKMWEMYSFTRDKIDGRGLFNRETGLWYRDKRFMPPHYKEPSGADSYWSRGNGWAYAALARVMDIIPPSAPHYADYRKDFLKMTGAIEKVQREDGFWNVSLHDPTMNGGKEGTGTALFVYGLAWGVNNGVLDREKYMPMAVKAWNALVKDCMHPDGALGYMQGRSNSTRAGLPLDYYTIHEPEDFAVGCFLLAGSEIYKLK